jgi:carbamoyl-phosphate synthase large subunit
MAYTDKIAKKLGVVGLINIQYAICDDKVYVLEANPRASRTVPIVSKVTGVLIARIATQLMLGKKLSDFPELKKRKKAPMVGVKEAVFPFNMFPEVDPVLGPEMRATGEVMGAADTFEAAFFKAEDAVGSRLPLKGNVLVTVTDSDKREAIGVARKLTEMGFCVYATEHTSKHLKDRGIDNKLIMKLQEGRPNIADAIINKEIQLIINTPVGKFGKVDDSYIRKMAIQHKIPYITTMAAAKASVDAIEAMRNKEIVPKALQDYHKEAA